MKSRIQLTVSMLVLAYSNLSAATLYVSPTSLNPTLPYTSWVTAATNIQDAVNAAAAGDTVLVTNGTYPGAVSVNTPLTLLSVDGPAVTSINGSRGIRCVYLTSGATLSGFTLTGGNITNPFAIGGGVLGESLTATVTNCFITENIACSLAMTDFDQGYGGGAYQATLNNCTLSYNLGCFGGGAAYCTLNNCTITNNSAVSPDGGGQGAYESTLNNCTLLDNGYGDGSAGGGAADCTLNNCILMGNHDDYAGGVVHCTLYNCTLIDNYADTIGGAYVSTLYNCIVYYNSDFEGLNYDGSCTFYYSCTTPSPGGIGNITNAPIFDGTLRQQSNSPCINSGDNAFAPPGPDLDGNPRIVGRTVDMGAYEYQTPSSILSYAWAQQYGLPTDGSEDYADIDDTGMANWQKSVAGLNPTNSASILALLTPVTTNSPAGLLVTWQSVNTREYFLQSSTNLRAQPSFFLIQSNLAGQPGTTSFTDTNAVGSGPHFYRVGVR